MEKYVDIIHVSAGSYYTTNQYTFPGIFVPHACNLHLARELKKVVNIAVATVGGHYDPAEMDRIIREGEADIVYMARQILADPESPNKFKRGRLDEVTPCTRCLNCLGNFDKALMGCDVNPKVGHELLNLNCMQPPEAARDVVVVGGGPGGMMAAVTAAERGHNVILIEKTDRLGGTLNYLEHDCHKGDLMRYKAYLERRVAGMNIDVRLNTEATPEMLDALRPFAVLVAVGAEASVPPIPGLKENGALLPKDLPEREKTLGERIVIIGGGLTGCEVGLHYAEIGKKVVVVEMGPALAAEANHIHRPAILETMERLQGNISSRVNTRCLAVTAEGIETEGPDGKGFIPADNIICAAGQRPKREAVKELSKCDAAMFEAFGDCVKLGQVRGAVHGGYYRALDVR